MNKTLSSGQQAAIHEWSKEQVESAAKSNFGKLAVTAPHLIELMGDVSGKSVLELGCGNGYWLRLLARMGAKCTGIDHAENQIEAAKNWDDSTTAQIEYHVGDVSDYAVMKNSFDIAFFEHVLLEITTKTGLQAAMKSAYQALKPGGKLIVSDLHPFAPSSRPDNLRVSDDFSYFDSGASIEIMSKRIDGEVIYYKDCHWTLSDILGAMTDAGFVITEVIEPLPSEEDVARYSDELSYRLRHPMAIMITARKIV